MSNFLLDKMMRVMIIMIAMMMQKTMIKSILMKHRSILALKSSLLSQKSFMRKNSEAQQIHNNTFTSPGFVSIDMTLTQFRGHALHIFS